MYSLKIQVHYGVLIATEFISLMILYSLVQLVLLRLTKSSVYYSPTKC